MSWPIGVTFLLGAAVACAEQSSGRPLASSVVVTEVTTGSAHAVEVAGLDDERVRRLSRLEPGDTAWTGVLAVYVERERADSAPPRSAGASRTPPVLGSYRVTDGRLRFEPRFPFAAGVAYRVEVDTAALASVAVGEKVVSREPKQEPLVHRFALPTTERPRSTRVVAVHPSAPRLPSNLLRWYVEFSAPMEPGGALAHARLLDESGREVRGAFLALDQELWDPERRRITLLLDPGRVKRGIRTNLESGAPLIAGRRYRLVIDDGWVDGAGVPLASGFEHPFEAVAADRRSPDPRRWRLSLPPAQSRGELRVDFGEPLDHALASRMLSVHDASGVRVDGSPRLAAGDSAWSFSPAGAWAAGDYTLRADTTLEDVAGNSIARPFDVDRREVSAPASAERAPLGVVLFRVVAAGR